MVNFKGQAGNDSLFGGVGDDELYGGAGKDVLTGGDGADQFFFNAPLGPSNVDRITDFVHLTDRIALDDSMFSSLSVGHLSAAAFRANLSGRAADATDRIIYEKDTGNLFYDADGTGAGASFKFAVLQPNLVISSADFLIM